MDDLLDQARSVLDAARGGEAAPEADLMTQARQAILRPRVEQSQQWAAQKNSDAPVSVMGVPGWDVNLGKEVGSETLGGVGISVKDVLRKAVPFTEFQDKLEAKRYGEAVKARDEYLSGKRDEKPSDTDLGRIAEYEFNQQRDAARSQRSKLAEAALGVPKVVGEFAAAGPIMRGVGGAAGLAAGSPVVTAGYLEESQQRANKNGGDWFDAKNLAAPLAKNAVQTVILGQIGKFANSQAVAGTASTALGRFAAKSAVAGAAMPLENAAADALTGGVQDALDSAGFGKYLDPKEERYKTVRDMLAGKWGDVGTRLATDSLLGAGFAAFHEREARPVEPFQDLMTSLTKKGMSRSAAAEVVQKDVGPLVEDIKAGRDISEVMDSPNLPEPAKKYLRSLIESSKPSEKPTPTPTKPSEGVENVSEGGGRPAEAIKPPETAPAEPTAPGAAGQEIAPEAKPQEAVADVERRIQEGTAPGGVERRRPEKLQLVNPERLAEGMDLNLSETQAMRQYPEGVYRIKVADHEGQVVGDALLAAKGDEVHVPWLGAAGMKSGEGRGVEPWGRRQIMDLARQIAELDPGAKRLVFTAGQGRVRQGVERTVDLEKLRTKVRNDNPAMKEEHDAATAALRAGHSPAAVAESIRRGEEAGLASRTGEGPPAENRPAGRPADSQGPPSRPAEAGPAPVPGTEGGATGTVVRSAAPPRSEGTRSYSRQAEGPKVPIAPPEPVKDFALAQEKTAEERAVRGLEPVVREAQRTDPEAWAKAEATMKADPQAGTKVVDSILAGEPVHVRDAVPILLRRKVELNNLRDRAGDELLARQREKAPDTAQEPLRRQLQDAELDLQRLEAASQKLGSETGGGFRFFQVLAAKDYTLNGLYKRAEIEKKGPLNEKERAEIEELHKEKERLQDIIEIYRNQPVTPPPAKTPARSVWDRAKDFLTGIFKLPESKKKEGKHWQQADLMEKAAVSDMVKMFGPDKLFSGFDPAAIPVLAKYTAAKIVKSGLTFADFSKRITEKFGDEIRPHLDAIWARAKKLASEPLDEKDAIIADEKVNNQIEEKIQKIKRTNDPLPAKIWNAYKEASGVQRLWQTALDLSSVLRQGGLFTLGNPHKAIPAFARTLNATMSERAFDRRTYDLVHSTDGKEFTQNGGYLAEPGKLGKGEEAFLGKWLKKVPVIGPAVKASERAYTAYLNEARVELYRLMRDYSARNSRLTKDEAAKLATFTNDWTGRAALPLGMEKSAEAWNQALFSPRYLWSRIRVASGANLVGGTMKTRQAIAREYAKSAIGMSVFIGAIKLALGDDAKVEFDPRSADFLKIRIGNLHLDPMTGLSQVYTALTRVVGGEFKSSETGKVSDIRKPTFGLRTPLPRHPNLKTGDVALSFARNKAAPLPGLGYDFLSGTTPGGGPPPTLGSAAKGSLIPITPADIKQAMTELGMRQAMVTSFLTFLGTGQQIYEPRPKKK
jgi:hypothetical protein